MLIDRLETAPKLLKLLAPQVRRQQHQPQLEPHVPSKLEIISARHLHLWTRFPNRSDHRTTSRYSEKFWKPSSPIISDEQLSYSEPPLAIPSRASCHFFLAFFKASLAARMVTPLAPWSSYASRLVYAYRARGKSVHLCHSFHTPHLHIISRIKRLS